MNNKKSPLAERRARVRRAAVLGRGMSTRRLLTTAQLQESLAITPPPSLPIACIAGLQCGLAVLLAIVAVYFSPWAHLVGFLALGALASLFGRFAPWRQRARIVGMCAALLTLGVFVPSVASYAGASADLLVLVLALLAGAFTLAVSHWQLGGPGAVIIVFAAGAALTPVSDSLILIERTLATAAGGLIAWLVCFLTDWMRRNELESLGLPIEPQRPFSHQLVAAGRITVGAGIAAFIAHAAGWQHPSWAAIGATAVMQGGHLHLTMSRSLQRMAGTIVGAFIVWAILAQNPTFWWIVTAIVIFQFVTEVIIGYNYALGQITITPMALLMTYLATPATAANMPVERVLDTILGATLGIVFAVIFSSLDDRIHLARHRKRTKLLR